MFVGDNMYSIGIDIGGMSIKAGLVDEQGVIVYKTVVKTAKTSKDAIIDILGLIDEILAKNKLQMFDINGIGIGCPGTISTSTGVVEASYNLGWEKVSLGEAIKNKYNTRVIVCNDAHVAVLGEVVFGCAKGYKSAVMFTLGTGVGGGVVIDGKLFEGKESKGTELGHTTLIYGGEKCSCGRCGCVEAYVSASALIRQTKSAMKKNKNSLLWKEVSGDINKIDGSTVFSCAKKKDETAVLVFEKYCNYLAESIMNMLNIFRPDAFILGGGVSNAGDFLLNKVKEICEKNDYGYKGAPVPELLLASLGNDAGIIGASSLVVGF